MSKPELGNVVGGRYLLLRKLGEGGMATVFEAENTLTQKRAAIKWLHPNAPRPHDSVRQLVHEARAASRVRHENVVDVYDVVEEGGSIYLVMELLEGEPLSVALRQGPPPVHKLISLLLPALRGVSAAHAAGVVHRDVKPDNIFLARRAGQDELVPKVIDFGISKVFDADSATITHSGVTMGTPRYVSYEQLLGARDVDARTDVYAFGVILYEALTGRAPYGDASSFAEQAVRFATQVPPAPRALRPEIPPALEAIVQRAIAKGRLERFQDVDELARALEPFADPARYDRALPVRLSVSRDVLDRMEALPTRPATPIPGMIESSVIPRAALRRPRTRMGWLAVGLFVCAAAVEVLTPRKPQGVDDVQVLTFARDASAPGPERPRAEPAWQGDVAATSAVTADASGAREAMTVSTSPSAEVSPRRDKPRAARTSQSAGETEPRAAAISEPATSSALPEQSTPRHRAGRLRRAEF